MSNDLKKLNIDYFTRFLNIATKNLDINKNFLCELDSMIGDGDHGITVLKGFKNAQKKIKELKPNNISEFFKIIGKTLITSIGGTTGPIFGSFFIEFGNCLIPEKREIDLKDLSIMFSNGLEKLKKIGGASPGDKTVVDTIHPVVKALVEAIRRGYSLKSTLGILEEAARKGSESTKYMIAKKGRARYLGERSIGYQDAGATSMYLIIKAMNDSL